MSLEQVNVIFQIAASVAVVASLIFVGLQIKGNTLELQRNEHNSTMEQWTVVRMAIAKHPEIAELMTTGLAGERPLDRAEELRLAQLLQEIAWAAFHIWDRTNRGVFPKGTFEATGGMLLCSVLTTPRGSAWWNGAKGLGFYPGFVADVDAQISKSPPLPILLTPAELPLANVKN
jgi:hypothetical protein